MRRSILFLVIILLFSACGGNKGARETDDHPKTAAKPFLLEVTADDFSFELAPTVPAGPLEIRLENAGTEPHQALTYKLNEGIDYKDYLKSVLRDGSQFPLLSRRVGGVNYSVSSGATEVQKGSDPYEPGSYALVCFVRETESGKNHYELGMIAPFTVE